MFNRKRLPEATELAQALGKSNSIMVPAGLLLGCINLQRILSCVLSLLWPEELIFSKAGLSLVCGYR